MHVSVSDGNCRNSSHAFTLIELLIVVLIIAILAAIAIPNFLEYQTRAKASRVVSDLRTFAVALEAYYGDNDTYPPDGNGVPYVGLLALTTPVAYLSTLVKDVFNNGFVDGRDGSHAPLIDSNIDFHFELGTGNANGNQWPASDWAMASYGPDLDDDTFDIGPYPRTLAATPYDPTNGTVSTGDIYRLRRPHANYITELNPETYF